MMKAREKWIVSLGGEFGGIRLEGEILNHCWLADNGLVFGRTMAETQIIVMDLANVLL